MNKQEQGKFAEDLARTYLESQNYRFLEANFYRRVGEIDLIMLAPDSTPMQRSIVFVEVRYRSRTDYGGALASIDWAKQRKLRRAALAWLQKYASSRDFARIDVIALEPIECNRPQDSVVWKQHNLTWIENAVQETT